ncbi:phage virion morphogenesis protein [Herbaspirillum seropedicae]
MHQEGLPDKVAPRGPRYKYPEHRLLGFSRDDTTRIREFLIAALEVHSKD